MSRKNRPQYHEPTDPVTADMGASVEDTVFEDTIEVGDVVLIEDPIDGSVDVGTVLLVDGPLDPVPLGTDFSETDFDETDNPRALEDFAALDNHSKPQSSKTTVDFGAASAKADDAVSQFQDKAQNIQDKAQDKAQDMAQNVTQAAQGIAGKAQDAAQNIAGKAQDVTKTVADKAQDATQKIADNASSAKAAAANAGSNSKSVVAGAASSAGMTLWGLMQRNPLQAIVFLASLVWLIRSNNATASQPAVSVSDAAGDAAQKVGTVAGQVQVAAGNLSSQVQAQAQHGAGWFSKTLQSNPLAIGAMGIVFGAGLGFAVPETSYEHKTLGKTRDALADKAQVAALDLGHKVQSVAQTAVHEAIESGKEEAKNQGLTPQETAPQEQTQQEQAPQQ